MTVQGTILKQLGGHKFAVMTGSKDFSDSKENTLGMKLARNVSGANLLEITLNAMDTYDMMFYRVSGGTMNKKTWTISPVTVKVIEEISDVYADQLQEVFTRVTGMYTRLF